MVNWGPFQDQYLHPIQATASLDQQGLRNFNFKVSDSRIGKHPVFFRLHNDYCDPPGRGGDNSSR